MKALRLSYADVGRIREILGEYRKQEQVQSMRGYIQHGHTSTYEHCMHVVFFSYWLNRRLGLNADERALLVGALLHDFYLYDWHEKSDWHRWHGFHHAHRACRNAKEVFGINSMEENIIESHMWPLTLRCPPKCREAAIVCLADKCCSLGETLGDRLA